ncbi:zinc-containing alcohol dehydrogenase (ADH) [Tieghemostelium lacteum]|uniref:Zinc-containing alcohol dehydrogenase (ADH) n=1 Tax=Tieghemostelium lacteum TaxID=361077 RepID=A0A152A3T2_TIELA|nr:zinc-containing alcohol dehydrogenase (ADH) [Tieghemostelium lacteum]|eukprot:KYR00923.1 zinc-containing alcohol dehydrogenase (ADH) [Tieghemostelium lacteum]
MSEQKKNVNRRFTLKSRPHGEPTNENFNFESVSVNPESVKDGEVLLRTIYLSLDPYMRGRMSDRKSYAKSLEIGDVIIGGSVCRVESSKNPKFTEGDYVLAYGGWQDYHITAGKECINLGKDPKQPSYALGILGMPGCTAYMGLLKIGEPKAGETVVVAAATGPVGSLVGQIAKIKGCRVIGIAGGKEKCEYAKKEFGFDECLDHKDEKLAEKLAEVCPKGIDVYFENVGGKVFDAVLPLLNTKARIPLCGMVSGYNATELPKGPVDRLPLLESMILSKRMRVQGFIVTLDFWDQFGEFYQQMSTWIQDGKVKYLEQIVDGFDKTVDEFRGLLVGKNFGKLVIRLGPDNL